MLKIVASNLLKVYSQYLTPIILLILFPTFLSAITSCQTTFSGGIVTNNPPINYTFSTGNGSNGQYQSSSNSTINTSKQYSSLVISNNSTLTISGNSTIQVQNTFKLKDNSHLIISGNVVIYATKFELGKNANITINSGASLTVYVTDKAKFKDYSSINTNNNPSAFALYSQNKIEFKKGGTYSGYFYAYNKIKSDNNNKPNITGSIVTNTFENGNQPTVSYSQPSSDLNIAGVCGSSTSNISLNQCFSDNFNRTSLGNKWSIIKQQNYSPNINGNKLILTDNSGNIATGVTLSGKFPSINNYVEIEFEHNAYGSNGNGADGVALVLADASILKPLINSNSTNIAGAFGGSLGYAQKNQASCTANCDGFNGGWLGFGLDEYGNFSKASEGRHGGVGFRKDSVAIRGAGSGQNGYGYITGTNTLSHGIDSTNAKHYKYKISIDSRTADTKIKVERDRGSGYSTLIDWTNDGQNGIPNDFMLSLTGSTGGSTNYHSIDDLNISALYCGTLGQVTEPPIKSSFDSWDISKDINSRTISTKKVSQNFVLSVVALNETSDALQDYNGSVCVRVVDSLDNNLSNWNKLQYSNQNLLNSTFNIQKANKDAKVQIVWKDNVTENCPLVNETNSTKSTDNFAIRPDKFNLTIPSIGYAGENFKVDFNADNSVDYNETLNTSFMVEANISKSSCFDGTLHVTPFSFVDGLKNGVDTNYSDVGDINITIKEILGSEFAVVDSGDTTDVNRLITPFVKTMTIKPYELNVTSVEYNTTIGQNWLYMADVNDLSQKVKATIVANDKQHNLVQNFTNACYAKDVSVKSSFAVTNTNSGVDIKYDDNTTASIVDINKTTIILKTLFITSKADLNYDFNIQRDYKIPYNPITIGLRRIDITSTTVAKEENNATVNLNTDFYYGRVKTEDLSTNLKDVNNSLHVEVYKLGKYRQSSLNWYVNEDDNVTQIGDLNDSSKFNSIDDTNLTINNYSFGSGMLNFTMHNPNQIKKAYVHVNIPKYLWYNTYNDFNATGDCSEHPCFIYKYIDVNSSKNNISSGVFSGSSIGKDFNATTTKRGVKTFR